MARRERDHEQPAEASAPPGPDASQVTKISPEVRQTLSSAIRNLSGGQVHCKLFRMSPLPAEYNGRMVHVHSWQHDSTRTDLEDHVYALGCERGWASGLFQLQLWLPGRETPYRTFEIAYEFPVVAAQPVTMGGQFREAVSTLREVKGLVEPSGHGAAMTPDTVASVFKSGVEVAKGQSLDLQALVTLAVDLLARFRPDPAAGSQPNVVQMADQMRALGWAPPGTAAITPPADPLRAQLDAKLAEIVLAGIPRILSGNPSTPAPNPLWGVLATLAPSILEVGNNFARAWLAHASARGRGASPAPVNAPPQALVPGRAVTAQPTMTLLGQFRDAIRRGDGSVFPALARTLALAGAIPILDGIRAGAIDYAWLRANQHSVGGIPELDEPGAEAFFTGFATWLQQQDEGAGGRLPTERIVAQCPACQADYTAEELAAVRQQFGRESCVAPIHDKTSGKPALCGATLTAVTAA